MIDFQEVEYSNLNRQILFDEADVGRSKCQVAAERIQEINHATRIESLATRLVRENARELVANSDVVVDAFDNREAKQVVNEACVAEGIPLVHAGIYGLECGVTSIIPRSSPCLRCIYPKPARRVESQPVLGPVAGLAACIEATEAIKLVTGLGEPITGRMLLIDMKIGMFSERKISRNAACPVCGQER
jgi:molybdopterin/thiamine biosynthesis adenylyltransferase